MKASARIGYLFFPALLFFITLPAHADDFSPDPNSFVYTNAIICESYTNLDPNTLYVFDYSPTIGRARGMGWATIQEGKCYQYDPQWEVIQHYEIPLPLTDKQLQELGLASTYPEGTLSDHAPDFDWNTIMGPGDGNFEPQVLGYGGNNPNLLLNAVDLVSFTKPVESALRGNGVLDDPVLADSKTKQAQDTLHSLAAQLSTQVQSCDTRVRIEERINGSGGSVTTIWRLKDGSDQLITASTTLGQELTYMGCDLNLVDTFKKAHTSQLATVDNINTYLQNLYGDPYNGTATKLSQEYVSKAGYGSADVQYSGTNNAATSTPLVHTTNDGTPVRIFPEDWFNYIYLFGIPIVGVTGLGVLWWLRRRKNHA